MKGATRLQGSMHASFGESPAAFGEPVANCDKEFCHYRAGFGRFAYIRQDEKISAQLPTALGKPAALHRKHCDRLPQIWDFHPATIGASHFTKVQCAKSAPQAKHLLATCAGSGNHANQFQANRVDRLELRKNHD